LTLTGPGNIDGTGNSRYNRITGNDGNNILNGGGGIDTLIGGAGNDTYVIDTLTDVIIEAADGGNDTVRSSRNISLATLTNVENVTLSGTAKTATGNHDRNVLTGTDAANVLDGGAGADTLVGGSGNDVYYVDDAGDVEVESSGGGWDSVYSSVSYTLSAQVEVMYLTGTDNLNGIGNSAWNLLVGNAGANVLNGGGGNDSLRGGLGDDVYIVQRFQGADTITDTDTDSTAGNHDTLWFNDSRIAHDQLWFRQVGNDLEVAVIGTGDKATIKGWYASPDNIVEEIRAGDGLVLESGEVDALVSAMSAFGARPAGGTTLTAEEQTALNPVFVATWS
jgi:Ca2+-binding RTX toxin-like protein